MALCLKGIYCLPNDYNMKCQPIISLLERYLSENCTEAERLMVENWYESLPDKGHDATITDFITIELTIWKNIYTTVEKN